MHRNETQYEYIDKYNNVSKQINIHIYVYKKYRHNYRLKSNSTTTGIKEVDIYM